jgi:hypothetical protein
MDLVPEGRRDAAGPSQVPLSYGPPTARLLAGRLARSALRARIAP